MPDPIAAPVAPAAPTNGAAPVKPTPVAPAAAAPEATFEVTVDGKPQKLTRKQIEKYAGKGAFADQAIRQASEALKATKAETARREELKAKIKTDKAARREWLKEHGIETDEFAREVLQEKLTEQEMTPAEREVAQAKADAAAARAEADELKGEKTKAAQAEADKRLVAKLQDDLVGACERHGMALTPDTLIALQPVARDFIEAGIPLDPDMMVETAKANIEGAFASLTKAVAGGLKGSALVERLGPEVVKEVLRWKTAEFRGGGPKPLAPVVPKPMAPEETMTPAQYAQKMRGG